METDIFKGPYGNFHNADGLWHKEDGPAVNQPYYKAWFINGYMHRLDGPARMRYNKPSEYWLYGKRVYVKSDEEFKRYVKLLAFL